MSQSIALITGASSGIGAATTVKLAQQGLHILLVARRLERLESQAEEIRQAGGQRKKLTGFRDRIKWYKSGEGYTI